MASAGEWKFIPQGTEAPTDGYFGDTETARETFEALKTTRLERDAWHDTVLVISGDIELVRQDAKAQLKALNKSFNDERKALKRKQTANTVVWFVVGGVVGLVVRNNS